MKQSVSLLCETLKFFCNDEEKTTNLKEHIKIEVDDNDEISLMFVLEYRIQEEIKEQHIYYFDDLVEIECSMRNIEILLNLQKRCRDYRFELMNLFDKE